jgi:hypothetical protein
MSTAVVLAILVAAGEGQAVSTTAMVAAAAEVVGSPAAVRVLEVPVVSDAEVVRTEQALALRAVVQLTWRDATRLSARLRLHATRTDRWVDRDISFLPDDKPTERGRTLGFAIASMLPEGDPTLELTSASVEAAPLPVAADESPGPRAVQLTALAGAGLGGPASGLGASLRVETFVSESASLGASLSGRLGRISALDADELTTSFGLGGAWWPVPPSSARRLGLGLRAEALLLYHAVSHDRAGGTTEWKGHALPGAAIQVESTWRLRRGLELVVAAGTEVAFGTIDVIIATAPQSAGTATIPALRALAEGGIRLRF